MACEPVDLIFGRSASEVLCAEVVVERAIAEHVVGGGEDGGRDGADGLLGARVGAAGARTELVGSFPFCG